ncbi:MAG: hypothetical protein ACRBBV_15720 [Paracoccaceae bacterium]
MTLLKEFQKGFAWAGAPPPLRENATGSTVAQLWPDAPDFLNPVNVPCHAMLARTSGISDPNRTLGAPRAEVLRGGQSEHSLQLLQRRLWMRSKPWF